MSLAVFSEREYGDAWLHRANGMNTTDPGARDARKDEAEHD